MPKQTHNPPNLFNSLVHGFSQIASAESGNIVFISGQVAWDENSVIIGPDDLALQANQAFVNLEKAVHSVGATLADVMMLRIYLVNYQPSHGEIISAVLKKMFGTESPPASSWIYVAGLAHPDFLIEVEGVVMTNHE